MTTGKTTTSTSGRDLVLTRVIEARAKKVIQRMDRVPQLLKQWFAPKPWTTPAAETDVRAGGFSRMVMRGPQGQEFPAKGVYLEVVANERLVFTDAFHESVGTTEASEGSHAFVKASVKTSRSLATTSR